jgi:hypothetical protein
VSTDALKVRQWLQSLGVLVATGMSVADAKERLAVFVPLLAAEFSGRYFNAQSLAFVARRSKFFPTFSEVCDGLHEWGLTLTGRSDHLIEGPARDENAAWKANIAAQRAESQRDWSDPRKVRSSRDLVLSDEVKQLELGRMLAALVNRHAPQNVGLLPPQWLENLPVFTP